MNEICEERDGAVTKSGNLQNAVNTLRKERQNLVKEVSELEEKVEQLEEAIKKSKQAKKASGDDAGTGTHDGDDDKESSTESSSESSTTDEEEEEEERKRKGEEEADSHASETREGGDAPSAPAAPSAPSAPSAPKHSKKKDDAVFDSPDTKFALLQVTFSCPHSLSSLRLTRIKQALRDPDSKKALKKVVC